MKDYSRKSMNDLMREVLAVLPLATFETDNDGQVVVYTGYAYVGGTDEVTTAWEATS